MIKIRNHKNKIAIIISYTLFQKKKRSPKELEMGVCYYISLYDYGLDKKKTIKILMSFQKMRKLSYPKKTYCLPHDFPVDSEDTQYEVALALEENDCFYVIGEDIRNCY